MITETGFRFLKKVLVIQIGSAWEAHHYNPARRSNYYNR